MHLIWRSEESRFEIHDRCAYVPAYSIHGVKLEMCFFILVNINSYEIKSKKKSEKLFLNYKIVDT